MLDLAAKPLIGMLHAPPLAGSPRFQGEIDDVLKFVADEADVLQAAGFPVMLLENYHDTPFFPGRVPAITIAHLTTLACALKEFYGAELGVNCLRNDGQTALAVAVASRFSFIRVNVLCGARVTDQGIVQGIAHDLLRERKALGAEHIRILADVDVKHSAALAARPLEEEVADLVSRGGADAVVVTGVATGAGVARDKLARVKAAAGACPVLVGSGVTADNLGELLTVADGAIVGSALKVGGRAENPVDPARAQAIVAAWRKVTGEAPRSARRE